MSKRTYAPGVLGGVLILGGASMGAQGAIIGTENFAYPDGPIAGQSGGTGWSFVRAGESQGATPSNWDNMFGTTNVAGGALVTQEAGAKREYGPDENAAAFRANEASETGRVFYRWTMTRAAGADWSGASSYDFGTEKVFFGVPGSQGANKFFGIDETGAGATFSAVQVVEGQTYTLVAMLDFGNDQLALWVDPAAGGDAPDVTRPMSISAGNWSTAIRFGSGGTAGTTWDNLTIASTPGEVGVPEPTSLTLLGLGVLPLLGRRRNRA